MFTGLKRSLFGGRVAIMMNSPAKKEKAVATLTKDEDEMTYLAFARMGKNLQSERELINHLLRLRESDVFAEIRKFEEGNRYFNGFSDLYQMLPNGFRVKWNLTSHSIIYSGHSYLSRRLETLNSISDTSKAALVIGSDAAKAEKFRTQGYPTPDQFTTAFDSSYVFLSRGDYATIELARWGDSELYLQYLKDISGTFGYQNRIIVIADSKEEVLKNFTESTKDGRRQVRGYVRLDDKQYKAAPEKILDVLEPPNEKELGLIDAFTVAYGGKLLRLGYFPGTKGRAPDNNMWTGDGMGRLLDAAHGIKREWRPFLTYKNWKDESVSFPDVSLRSVEDAARALHVVNCLTEVFQKNGLI